jgi:2-methylcitrate dehydratase PrpD
MAARGRRPVTQAAGPTATIIRLSRAAADHVPAATREMAKLCVLDWFGLALAGSCEPLAVLLRDGALADGARPLATVVGYGRAFSPRQAALINGAAGHALDYDDVNLAMRVHPTTVILPGLLALAEADGLSGRALIAAFVAGYEAAGLIGTALSASHYARGFHATGTIGSFGAAAACAHLLNLDDDETARAYGLAGSQAAGLKAQFGTMAKSLHAGRAAEAGLTSAQWARDGMTARPDILERPLGFATTQTNGFSAEGVRWRGYELNRNLFKYHAACFGTHGTLEAIGALRRTGLRPENVRAIRLKVDAGADAMCNIAAPRTGLETKFSLRFNAALALHGADTANSATYADLTALRPELEATRAITSVELAPADWPEDVTEVTVTTIDGEILVQRHDISLPPGDLAFQAERLHAKFLTLAAPVIGHDRAETLAAAIGRLEHADDISGLMDLAALH